MHIKGNKNAQLKSESGYDTTVVCLTVLDVIQHLVLNSWSEA